MADAGAAASDVADPSSVSTHQVPRLLGVVATDRRRFAVSAHPATRHTSRHVGATDRCIVATDHTQCILFSVARVALIRSNVLQNKATILRYIRKLSISVATRKLSSSHSGLPICAGCLH